MLSKSAIFDDNYQIRDRFLLIKGRTVSYCLYIGLIKKTGTECSSQKSFKNFKFYVDFLYFISLPGDVKLPGMTSIWTSSIRKK